MSFAGNGHKQKPPAKNRKRKITWFNPPFCKSVKTNIGKRFLDLIDKHFPIYNKYRKLFNRNNVKVSYCCMENMGQLIAKHNKFVIRDKPDTDTNRRKCNCRNKNMCPLDGNCQASAIIYKATVATTDGIEKDYFGLCETTFKDRYNNHKNALKHKISAHSTKLSEYVWKIKDDKKKKIREIKWQLMVQSTPYLAGSRKCNLCLAEKLVIALADKSRTLNERSEIISKCRHKSKFVLV